MANGTTGQTAAKANAGFGALWRFLPMLWPKGEAELKARVVVAVVLVLAGKAAVLLMPFAYKAVIDGMSGGNVAFARRRRPCRRLRDGPLCWRTLRQSTQCPVRKGRTERRPAARHQVFRHVHDLSLRFHLERRTGSLTKIVERGTKSIDMMLYFILFNIAPTVIELAAICIIFWVKFGAGLVAATLAMVAALHHLHPQGDRLARANPATDERSRQQCHRPCRRQSAELRDGQIFRRRRARGQAL